MKLIRIAAVAMLAFATAACSDDGDGGGSSGSSGSSGSGGSSGGSCTGTAEITASPTASPTTVSAGDTVTVMVPVNDATTFVRVQLQSAVDGSDYGDGEAASTGGTDEGVTVDVATGAPAGTLYPFVQVYECGKTDVSTQYAPDFSTGDYMTYRSDDPGSAMPSGFTAPGVTVQ